MYLDSIRDFTVDRKVCLMCTNIDIVTNMKKIQKSIVVNYVIIDPKYFMEKLKAPYGQGSRTPLSFIH